MKGIIDSQENARRFNKDEAVWRSYERKKKLRRLAGLPSPLPNDVLDYLDWLAAERECRETRLIGKFIIPSKSFDQ